MSSSASVIDSYARHLVSKHRKACRQFLERSREAQLAEAIVFGILQRKGAKPELADQYGGPDFLCADEKFVVEATAFTIGKVVSDSAMPNGLPSETGAHAYRHLTREISERAGKKNSQLSVGLPAVLAIVCDHVIAHIVNLQSIKHLWTLAHGQYVLELISGERLQSSRSYGEKIRTLLSNPF
jgi:hypothetical protein